MKPDEPTETVIPAPVTRAVVRYALTLKAPVPPEFDNDQRIAREFLRDHILTRAERWRAEAADLDARGKSEVSTTLFRCAHAMLGEDT